MCQVDSCCSKLILRKTRKLNEEKTGEKIKRKAKATNCQNCSIRRKILGQNSQKTTKQGLGFSSPRQGYRQKKICCFTKSCRWQKQHHYTRKHLSSSTAKKHHIHGILVSRYNNMSSYHLSFKTLRPNKPCRSFFLSKTLP